MTAEAACLVPDQVLFAELCLENGRWPGYVPPAIAGSDLKGESKDQAVVKGAHLRTLVAIAFMMR